MSSRMKADLYITEHKTRAVGMRFNVLIAEAFL
jgi:hypothetical protein